LEHFGLRKAANHGERKVNGNSQGSVSADVFPVIFIGEQQYDKPNED
jgi:hypothetical protein